MENNQPEIKKTENQKKLDKIKKSLITKKDKTIDFLLKVYHGEESYTKLANKFINAVKVFIVSTRKFMFDDCLTKASSIAYTVLISLIPTLTVILSVYGGSKDKKEQLFREISLKMTEYNLKINIDPILSAISGLIDNAGKIGIIGSVIMIFSATAMLRSMEKSLNHIFNVQRNRSFFMKIIYYWSALTLGPLMIVAGTTIASKASSAISSSNYYSAYISNNKLWVVGDSGKIRNTKKDSVNFKNISTDYIDFNNQKIYKYNLAENKFSKSEFDFEKSEFSKSSFTDIQFIGLSGWVIAKNGLMLYTKDGGERWSIYKFGSFKFNDIHMIDKNRGFISSDNGNILKTIDGGKTWEVNRYELKNYTPNFNKISFKNSIGIITATKGTILQTYDNGLNWNITTIPQSKRKNRAVNLNDIHFVSSSTVWIAGNEGVILKSHDLGKTWSSIIFKEKNYTALHFFNSNRGFIAGEKGYCIYTKDGGVTWDNIKLPDNNINKLIYKDKKIWAIGNNGIILFSKNLGKSWSGLKGNNFIPFIINFFAPFIFIWLMFLLFYISLPNTKVPFKKAAIGAAFTGTVWVIFISLFTVYIKSFATGTLAVYGALASIPLFLLLVYASSLIILYGAEISYTLMHPETYSNLKKILEQKKDIHVYFGISILNQIYKKFEQGNGASSFSDIAKVISNKIEEADFFLNLFVKNKIISRHGDNTYSPANSSGNIYISDIIESIYDISYKIPGSTKTSKLKGYMNNIFTGISESRKKVVGKITLKDVIENS